MHTQPSEPKESTGHGHLVLTDQSPSGEEQLPWEKESIILSHHMNSVWDQRSRRDCG